jgi:2'-5' RNA ligase
MRLFIAVDLGPDVGGAAADALARGRTLAPRAKWVQAENLHLTLVFLGATDDALVPGIGAAIATVAARHPPVSLHVAGAGGFGSARKPRVLWLGIAGEVQALGRIQQELEEALAPFGHVPEKRDFRPHLTLARARDPRGEPDLAAAVAALADDDLGDARIDRLILFRSDLSPKGPRYTEVASAALAGDAPA